MSIEQEPVMNGGRTLPPNVVQPQPGAMGSPWSGPVRPGAASPSTAGARPAGPTNLDPAVVRPALRKMTLVAGAWSFALVASLLLALAGWGVHRSSLPTAPPGGRVARGVVRSTSDFAGARVYEVRLRGGRETVVVPGLDQTFHRNQEVWVRIAESGRPVDAEPLSWTGMGMAVTGGAIGLVALFGVLLRVPSALTIRRQFALGLVLTDGRVAGSAPKVGVNIGRTAIASLLGAIGGIFIVSYRRRYAGGPARIQMSYPSSTTYFLEVPRHLDALRGAPLYVPMTPSWGTARAVFDGANGRILRVRRKPPR